MFARLGSWCFRRRRLVAVLWVVGIIVVGSISSSVGGSFGQDFNPPGEASRGRETLEASFGDALAGMQGTVVFQAEQGVEDPEVKAAMEQYFAQIAALAEDGDPDLEAAPFADLTDAQREELEGTDLSVFDGTTVQSPYDAGPRPQINTRGEAPGTIAYATLSIPGEDFEDMALMGRTMEELAPEVEGLRVELGGQVFAEFTEPSSETLGLAFAIVILVVAFGSVLAMGLPIGVALAGIAAGSVLVTLLSNLLTMPDFSVFLGVMIGLGVGIDYALFIVTRYRENLHHDHTPEEAVSIALDTAGRAVAFAGVTVVVSFLGMLVMGVSFIQGLAIASATVVLMTVLASLTLLPALLGFAGHRVEVSRWRGVIATGFVALGLVGAGLKLAPLAGLGFFLAVVTILAGFVVPKLKEEVPRRETKPLKQTFAYRWSRLIQHHPWPAALAGTAILLILAIPMLSMRLGFSDEGNYAEDTTTRQAYDLLAEGFGDGHNGPFFLAAAVDGPVDQAVLDDITAAVAADPGVANVTPAIANTFLDPEAELSAYLWEVTPTTSPQAEETPQLVDRLRAEILPPGEAALGTEIAVTGMVPGMLDFSEYLAGRMPWFFAAVLIVSFLLLMAVFRSVLVPLKAVIMNLLSIGAAYGITVAVVQWAWGSDVTGLAQGPIETFAPMMFFAIVFGLSMDYEVFLLSRVKEEWHRTGDSHLSVANGLAATARVITAAAAIMVFVFGSFLLEQDRIFQLFGVGLASAILLDATVVRMLLVPATMELLGDRNWWLPGWLDRIIPNIDVEGTPDEVSDFDDSDDPDDQPERELVTV